MSTLGKASSVHLCQWRCWGGWEASQLRLWRAWLREALIYIGWVHSQCLLIWPGRDMRPFKKESLLPYRHNYVRESLCSDHTASRCTAWLLVLSYFLSFLWLTLRDLGNQPHTAHAQQQAAPKVMKWMLKHSTFCLSRDEHSFLDGQGQWNIPRAWLSPADLIQQQTLWSICCGTSFLPPITLKAPPRLQSVLSDFHLYTFFFLLLLFDGDTHSKEKQINSWELELISLRKTQIHPIFWKSK